MQVKCLYCGCLFEVYDARRKYCSAECCTLGRKEQFIRRNRKKRSEVNGTSETPITEEPKVSSAASVKHKEGDDKYSVMWKKSENMIELERLAKEAYDHGMNYGKYVAKKDK